MFISCKNNQDYFRRTSIQLKKDAPNAPRRLNPKGPRFDRPRVFYDLIVHPSHGAARPFKKG